MHAAGSHVFPLGGLPGGLFVRCGCGFGFVTSCERREDDLKLSVLVVLPGSSLIFCIATRLLGPFAFAVLDDAAVGFAALLGAAESSPPRTTECGTRFFLSSEIALKLLFSSLVRRSCRVTIARLSLSISFETFSAEEEEDDDGFASDDIPVFFLTPLPRGWGEVSFADPSS